MRVLFIAEAVTLAHVARSTALAELLDPVLYDVCLACDKRYEMLFEKRICARRDLHSISAQAFSSALDKGLPIYNVSVLSRYVKDDLRVIEDFQPDVVIGDFRISLSVSARVAERPYITITNAGWSPYSQIKFAVPDIVLTRILGIRAAQKVFDLARPLVFAVHSLPLNRMRRRYGLAPLPYDLRCAYTDADFVLYADIPELIPIFKAPLSHSYLGPIAWSPDLPEPEWIGRVPDDRPVIYVSLGSSGQHSVLPVVLEGLGGLPFTIVVATAGKSGVGRVASNTFVSEYLAGQDWVKRASLVICNGGSPTCYQAFAEGIPVLGIPGNLDQYLNMTAVESFGAGKLLRAHQVSSREVISAISELWESSQFREKAQRLGQAIKLRDPGAELTKVISRAVSSFALNRRH